VIVPHKREERITNILYPFFARGMLPKSMFVTDL